jgi:hypothetical protein
MSSYALPIEAKVLRNGSMVVGIVTFSSPVYFKYVLQLQKFDTKFSRIIGLLAF